MRTAWMAVLAMLATNLLPAQVNPKVWNLIGPDDRLILGVNMDRYRQTAMNSINSGDSGLPFPGRSRYVITIESNPQKGQRLIVLLGFSPAPVVSDESPSPTMLDATTAIVGDDERVRASVARWSQEAPVSELASEARKLGESDDAWFLVIKPLALGNPIGSEGAPKHLREVVDVVEQAAGGVRFGEYYQAHLDVRTKTSDDAYSLAALGRWLPGLIQAMEPGGKASRLIDLAEDLTVQAVGRTVMLSFALPENKLAELLRKLQSDIVE